MIGLVEVIGLPATLELLAEETSELSHAALKLARIVRGENPTPVKESEAVTHLAEEMADVGIMLEQVKRLGGIQEETETWRVVKLERMIKRLNGGKNDDEF